MIKATGQMAIRLARASYAHISLGAQLGRGGRMYSIRLNTAVEELLRLAASPPADRRAAFWVHARG